jgi:hypothetical protein
MRVRSLSDARLIRLISDHFVPVWVSRDDYQLPAAGKDDKALLTKIDTSRHAKKLEGGTVCVFIANHEGDVVATLPVQRAFQPELLKAFLDKIVLGGKPRPRSGSLAKADAEKANPAKGRTFLIRTRFDDSEVNSGTSRDRVELTPKEMTTFVPAKAEVGTRWKLEGAVAEKLLRYAYPPLPHWDAKLARVEKAALTARVISVEDGKATLWLEGDLELTYPVLKTPTDGKVTARLAATAEVDVRSRELKAFTLASRGAGYVWYWKGEPQPRKIAFVVELER